MPDPRPQSPQTPGAPSREHHRAFSFRSDQSGASQPKESLTESPREKQRRDSIWKSTSKANPNAALTEAQPGVNAVLEESTITPLRGIQHKDAYGNPITDPDLANPTRPRMERPLDTIRSFEAAIDSAYKRRSNHMRSESAEQAGGHGASRTNSAYGFGDGPSPNNRYAYGNGNGGGGGGYYGGQRDSYGGAGPSARPRYGRGMQSEPMMQGRPYVPQHGHQPSQDTMNTAHGSDSTGPWNSGTDPSSENSSIDKNYQQNGYQNGYGPNAFSGPIPEEGGAYPAKPGYGGAPAVQPSNARRPIPLGNSDSTPSMPTGNLPSTARPEPEKRKSWLKRRFSKKD